MVDEYDSTYGSQNGAIGSNYHEPSNENHEEDSAPDHYTSLDFDHYDTLNKDQLPSSNVVDNTQYGTVYDRPKYGRNYGTNSELDGGTGHDYSTNYEHANNGGGGSFRGRTDTVQKYNYFTQFTNGSRINKFFSRPTQTDEEVYNKIINRFGTKNTRLQARKVDTTHSVNSGDSYRTNFNNLETNTKSDTDSLQTPYSNIWNEGRSAVFPRTSSTGSIISRVIETTTVTSTTLEPTTTLPESELVEYILEF